MTLLPHILANTPPPDTLISGDWMLKLIGAIFAGAALVLGRYWGRKEASETKIADPVPEVPTRKVSTPPSWDAHRALERRVESLETETEKHREYVEAQLRLIRAEQSEQFVKLMTAGETRKDAIMETMNAMVRNFHARVDQLIDGHRAIKKP